MLYVDGELEPARVVEMETHIVECCRCRDQLDLVKSMRASLRRSVARAAPSSLEARLRAALCDGAREDVAGGAPAPRDVVTSTGGRSVFGRGPLYVEARPVEGAPALRERRAPNERRRWVVAAVAMAACFVFVVVLRSDRDGVVAFGKGMITVTPGTMQQRLAASGASAPARSAGGPAANDEVPSLDAVVEKLVDAHVRPLPPEERDPQALARLEEYVGVPVKRPAIRLLSDLSLQRARFEGARIHPLPRDSRNAAALHYRLPGHRLTVYVFDPRVVSMARTRLQERPLRNADAAYVGRVRGFSVAAAKKGEVGYALATDLDEDRSLQMVASF